MGFSHTVRLAVLASTMFTPGMAFAQDAASTDAAEADAGEIIVTARRREERIQDVPVSITAASGDDLRRMSIVKPEELTRVSPGLVVTQGVYGGGNLNVTIRSQRQALNNTTYDQSVGVYFAEVPQARTQGLNSGFFDIASVQILKGPQGTLFGRNTTGGALLITPAAPTDEFTGYVKGTYGAYNLADFEAAVNAPISDRIQLRLAGKVTRRDGTIYSTTDRAHIGNVNNHSWRASLRLLLSDAITNTLVVTGHRDLSDGTVMKINAMKPTGTFVTLRDGLSQLEELKAYPFHTTTAPNLPNGTDIKTLTVSNITEFDLGFAKLKNIFGYRKVDAKVDWLNTGDRYKTYRITPIDNGKQISEELNLSGEAMGGNLDYFMGLFYLRESNHSEQITYNNYTIPYTSTATTIANTIADPVNTSYSAYAQATWKNIALEGLSLTAGIRYTKDKREIEWSSVFTQPAGCRLVDATRTPLSPCFRSGSAEFSAATWNLSLDYKVAPDVLVYAVTRRGYRAGGFTFTAYSPGETQAFKPEFVNDYEIGLKSAFDLGANARLRFNLAAYHQDYKDVQRNVTYTPGTPQNPGLTPIVFFVNAATAKVDGFELDANLNVSDRLELAGSFSYSNARYTAYLVNGVDYSKAPFAGAPKYTATWMARYALVDDSALGRISAAMNGFYQSSTVSTDATSFNTATQLPYPDDVIKARHIVDASLEWSNVKGSGLDLRLFAKNVFKTEYYGYIQNAYYSAIGNSAATLGEPRTWGIEVKYSF